MARGRPVARPACAVLAGPACASPLVLGELHLALAPPLRPGRSAYALIRLRTFGQKGSEREHVQMTFRKSPHGICWRADDRLFMDVETRVNHHSTYAHLTASPVQLPRGLANASGLNGCGRYCLG
jgi:hypothetical protein